MKYYVIMIRADKGEKTVTLKPYEYERAKAIVERAVDIYILGKDCPNLFEWITPYFYTCFLANLYFFLEKVEEEKN